MKKSVSWALILSFAFHLVGPVAKAIAEPISTSEQILAQRRGGGGGGRSNSGGGRSINHSRDRSGSNRVNRSSINSGGNRANRDRSNRASFSRERDGSNRVNRAQTRDINRDRANNINRDRVRDRANNIDRDRVRDRANNIDRDRVRDRVNNIDRNRANNFNSDRRNNFNSNNRNNFNSDRRYSNRINRNNNFNNINVNRNVFVNPRGYSSWGWHGGSPWYPNNTFWGGGFWGPFAVGTVVGGLTGALITSAAQNNNNRGDTYIIVKQGTPGYNLLDSYGLRQTRCTDDVIVIYGPENSVICATPTSRIPAGTYDTDTETLTLIAR